ncbi:MAG: hypothetical protein ACUVRL_07535 [Candidatus Saccharicenans sp.]|uniref:hypothetical protein n=1 Tax=Candidatus Saccharicenans sp. TaxID=2819258 RepID=UPI00404A769D
MEQNQVRRRVAKLLGLLPLALILILFIPGPAQGQQPRLRSVTEIPIGLSQERPYFFRPSVLALSSAGLLVSESGDHRLRLIGKDGQPRMVIGKHGQSPEEFDTPLGLDMYDNKIYVADSFNRQVKIFSLEGKLLSSFRTNIQPVHLAVLNPERIVVSNRPTPAINQESILYCYDSRGALIWQAVEPAPAADTVYFTLINEIFLKRDEKGNLFLFHRYNEPRIMQLNAEGKITGKINLDPAYPLKKVELPLKSEKKSLTVVCWNAALAQDRFYLLIPASDRQGDIGQGQEVSLIDRQGKILEIIRFPQPIRLLATDGSTFYVLNTEDELYIYRGN